MRKRKRANGGGGGGPAFDPQSFAGTFDPPPGAKLIQKPTRQVEPDGEPEPDSPAHHRAFVKKMMKSAWQGYRDNAWGTNELMPKSRKGHSAGIFGASRCVVLSHSTIRAFGNPC